MKKQNKIRLNLTLDPAVLAAFKDKALPRGMPLSAAVNEMMAARTQEATKEAGDIEAIIFMEGGNITCLMSDRPLKIGVVDYDADPDDDLTDIPQDTAGQDTEPARCFVFPAQHPGQARWSQMKEVVQKAEKGESAGTDCTKEELIEIIKALIEPAEKGLRNCESDAGDGVEGAEETLALYREAIRKAKEQTEGF